MKKLIISILVILILGSFISYNIYDNNRREKIGDLIVEILNGYDIINENTDKGLAYWGREYQNSNFYPDDYKYVILSDVSGFNNCVDTMKKAEEIIKNDPFTVIENIEGFDTPEMEKFYPYYSEEVLPKDTRIIEENNKYFIKISDLNFDSTGHDEISYGNFLISVNEREVGKETFTQRQMANRFSLIGSIEDGNIVTYRIFDTKINDSIDVVAEYSVFFVKCCYIK